MIAFGRFFFSPRIVTFWGSDNQKYTNRNKLLNIHIAHFMEKAQDKLQRNLNTQKVLTYVIRSEIHGLTAADNLNSIAFPKCPALTRGTQGRQIKPRLL